MHSPKHVIKVMYISRCKSSMSTKESQTHGEERLEDRSREEGGSSEDIPESRRC